MKQADETNIVSQPHLFCMYICTSVVWSLGLLYQFSHLCYNVIIAVAQAKHKLTLIDLQYASTFKQQFVSFCIHFSQPPISEMKVLNTECHNVLISHDSQLIIYCSIHFWITCHVDDEFLHIYIICWHKY